MAYHSLAAALHCAEDLGDEQSVASIERVAKAQQERIDAQTPEHQMSTGSVTKRGGTSMYYTLARQAAVRVQILQQKHRQENREHLLWAGDTNGEK